MRVYPRTAVNDAQHKMEKLLKSVCCMVCLCLCECECMCTCVCSRVCVCLLWLWITLSSAMFEAGSLLLFCPPSELRETLLSPIYYLTVKVLGRLFLVCFLLDCLNTDFDIQTQVLMLAT